MVGQPSWDFRAYTETLHGWVFFLWEVMLKQTIVSECEFNSWAFFFSWTFGKWLGNLASWIQASYFMWDTLLQYFMYLLLLQGLEWPWLSKYTYCLNVGNAFLSQVFLSSLNIYFSFQWLLLKGCMHFQIMNMLYMYCSNTIGYCFGKMLLSLVKKVELNLW